MRDTAKGPELVAEVEVKSRDNIVFLGNHRQIANTDSMPKKL